MKRLMLGLVVILILVLSFNALGVSEDECAIGDGVWTTPTVSQGDDPISNEKAVQPFCNCDLGFYWNDSLKSCENDSELRCVQTKGIWINGECQCPEGTVKFTPGFGCDMPGPEPKENKYSKSALNLETLLLISIFSMLFIIVIIVYFYIIKRKNKKSEGRR